MPGWSMFAATRSGGSIASAPEPLQELDEWLEPFRREWSNRLDNLERHLERTAAAPTKARPSEETS